MITDIMAWEGVKGTVPCEEAVTWAWAPNVRQAGQFEKPGCKFPLGSAEGRQMSPPCTPFPPPFYP